MINLDDDMAQPDVLVTGSSGHLGFALMLELPRNGYTPIGLDVLPSEITALVGSIADRTFVSRVFRRFPSIRYVLHTATFHKPHVGSHGKDAFVETNIKGTLVLLEESSRTGNVEAFVFTSTTSTFGSAMTSKPGQPAVWIDEYLHPIPKNIYGATKVAAEDICQLIHNETNMPIIILKTSRFFPEQDDDENSRIQYTDDNLKVTELLYRRADIADVVTAHICAMRQAKSIEFSKYIISAPPPFHRSDGVLADLDQRAPEVISHLLPHHSAMLLKRGWKLPYRLDRIYDSAKALRELQWQPVYTFTKALELLDQGHDYRSELAIRVGKRGYHREPTGVYTS